MSFSVTKQFRFEAAHRLVGHQGKCRFLHGHSYRVFITVTSDALDDMEMVCDFGDLKEIQHWIDLNLDHNTILWVNDSCLSHSVEMDGGRRPYLCSANPTAEHLAKVIHDETKELVHQIGEHLRIESVMVYETESSCATYVPEEKK